MSKAEETTLNFNYEEDNKKKKGKKEKNKLTVFDVLEPIVAALLVITVILHCFSE